MNYRLAFAALCLCGGLWAQSQDAVLAKALAAHQAGDYEAAVQGYRDYLSRKPNSYEIRSNLGAALSRLGLYSEAAQEYKSALKLAPNNPNIALNLALARYKDGDIAEAAQDLARLHGTSGGTRQVDLLLADCWLRMGENQKVIDLLTPLDQKTPDDLSLAYLLGTALVREKRTAEGTAILNRFFAKGESAEGWLLMGSAKLAIAAVSDDYEGAVKDLSRAVEMNPKLPTLNGLLGRAYLGVGDAANAAKAFRAEIEVNPADFEALLNLAVLAKQEMDYATARKLLGSAIRVRPGDPAVRYQLATIDLAEGRVPEARMQLESLIKASPDFIEAHVSLAAVYYRLKLKAEGDRERAVVKKLEEDVQARQRQEFPAQERKN